MKNFQRISFAASLLAGSVLAAAPLLAQPAHPVGHPSTPVHRAAAPHAYHGFRPGFRPGVGFHRLPAARLHPLHAILGGHVSFAHFSPAQRVLWTHGRWYHRWWNGRYGWWWYAGGVWFWYGAPIYPYPTAVSDYYYEEPASDEGPTWWYCYNPPGYYPYVQSCSQPWTAVPAQGSGYDEDQGGPDQGPPPGDQYNEQGPPPGYGQDQGPPPGYGNEQGPPPGYGNEQGPPQGYGNEQGPPPGYGQGPDDGYGPDQGPPPGDEGPPPDNSQYPHNSR